ncbi:MAG: hypothetical protein CME06_02505 [Gemmatimonadetes bacterium]|nr:hypothetical protein [Gemmatimonadota bacterium]
MSPSERRALSERFVSWVLDRPWRALCLGLAIVALLLPGGARLETDFSYRIWFNDDDPLLLEFDSFERRFGNDEAVLVIVHSPSGVFDVDSAELLMELTDRLWRVPEVLRVESLSNFNWVHADHDELVVEPLIPDDMELTQGLLDERRAVALAHETIPGNLVSADARTALLVAKLRPALKESGTAYETVVTATRDLIVEFEGRGDHTLMQAGSPAISHSFKEAMEVDILRLLPLTIGLTVLFLLLFFRSAPGVLLPFAVITLSITATMAAAGWLGISINNITSAVPQILLAIAVADSVHILATHHRARGRGAGNSEAAHHALLKNFQPTLLTSVSTAIGFFSFSTADVVPIGQMGTMAGLGTLIAWLITYLVLGPLLVLVPARNRKISRAGDLQTASARGLRNAALIGRRRRSILSAFCLVTALAFTLVTQTEVNSDPLGYFPDDSPLNIASSFLEKHVGGSIAIEIVVDSGEPEGALAPAFLRRADELQAWVAAKPYVTSALSLIDILKATNRSLHGDDPTAYAIPATREGVAQQYLLYTLSLPQGMDLNDRVSVRNDALRITTMWNIHDSRSVLREIETIEKEAEAIGLDAHITGKNQLYQRMNPYVVRAFVASICSAVLLMSVLLIGVYRSLYLGGMAMISNAVPLLIGAGLLVAIGRPLDIGTVVVFSTCLGIAVDYTIHFLTNFNRVRNTGREPEEAIAEVFTHTLPPLVVTTVILVSGFGVFAAASFIPNRYFGTMVAFILLVALATNATLVPAILSRRRGK